MYAYLLLYLYLSVAASLISIICGKTLLVNHYGDFDWWLFLVFLHCSPSSLVVDGLKEFFYLYNLFNPFIEFLVSSNLSIITIHTLTSLVLLNIALWSIFL